MEFDRNDNEHDARARHLTNLMYGHNYQPSFGVIELEETGLDACAAKLQRDHPDALPPDPRFEPIEGDAWVAAVQNAFAFRGDDSTGLALRPEQEEELRVLQAAFLSEFRDAVVGRSVFSANTSALVYGPYWAFSFVFLGRQGSICFHGGATD